MLNLINVVKHLPKKIILIKPSCDTIKYFNYKDNVNMSNICFNLLKKENSILLDYLTIYSNNHYKYRDLLYNNLEKVSVEKMNFNTKVDGSFNMYYGECKLMYMKENTIYHEILHMASSYYDRHNNILFTGFNYCDLTKKINIGEGLTEGYVQYITDRDTNNANMIYKHDYDEETCTITLPIVYCYANALAAQLEVIIGKDKLEKLFFKADFFGLMDELLKYGNEDEVLKFFKDCDAACINNYLHFKYLDKRVLDAQNFLFSICVNYMPERIPEMEKYEIRGTKKLGYGNILPIKILNEINEKKKQKILRGR